MKLKYLSLLLVAVSSFANASDKCAVEAIQGANYLVTKSKKVQIDLSDYALSKLKLENYCMFYGSSENTQGKAIFINKNSGTVYQTDNFVSAKQSPNSKFVAVVSENGAGSITQIALLNKQGQKKYAEDFSLNVEKSNFVFDFSSDSNFLNFYKLEEFSINYNTLDLEKGSLYENVADGKAYQNALLSNPSTRDTTFVSFIPVKNDEFAAATANNYIGYYKNAQSIWTKRLDGEQGLAKIIAVGNVYVVVANASGGIDLFKKSDGTKYTVLTKTGEQFSPVNLDLVDRRFISGNRILLTYRNGKTGKIGKVLIDLDKNTVVDS